MAVDIPWEARQCWIWSLKPSLIVRVEFDMRYCTKLFLTLFNSRVIDNERSIQLESQSQVPGFVYPLHGSI